MNHEILKPLLGKYVALRDDKFIEFGTLEKIETGKEIRYSVSFLNRYFEFGIENIALVNDRTIQLREDMSLYPEPKE